LEKTRKYIFVFGSEPNASSSVYNSEGAKNLSQVLKRGEDTMSFSKLSVCFATLAIAVASAASNYSLTLFEPSTIGSTELKPGDYKLELNGEKATIKAGKNTVEAAVKVESGSEKFSKTTVKYTTGDGKYRVQEIRLGGTKTTLKFPSDANTNN
jgi:hypothetical protein